MKPAQTLYEKYPPSEPCSCAICQSYCKRPGWWTVEEAERAIHEGFANRMMLELSPEGDFIVLSPAFKGNEVQFALKIFSENGCTFFNQGLCELFGRTFQPLECRFCHHQREGMGLKCHADIEQEWKSKEAKRLVLKWGNLTGFWHKQGLIMIEKADS